jgi:seryl-tRNA synthetase
MEELFCYEERIRIRKKLISKIDNIEQEMEVCSQKIKDNNKEIEELKNKIENLEENIVKEEEKKKKFRKLLFEIKGEYVSKGIPVPEDGKYEIENGIVGMKRDINVKLMKNMFDDDLRHVFLFF